MFWKKGALEQTCTERWQSSQQGSRTVAHLSVYNLHIIHWIFINGLYINLYINLCI